MKFESLLFSLLAGAVLAYLAYLGVESVGMMERRIVAEIERAPK